MDIRIFFVIPLALILLALAVFCIIMFVKLLILVLVAYGTFTLAAMREEISQKKDEAAMLTAAISAVETENAQIRDDIAALDTEEGVEAIGENAFAQCEQLEEIVFKGDAPEMGENCFEEVEATIYHPVDNDTWTEEVLESTGGEMVMEAVDFSLIPGDVNGNRIVDAADAYLIVLYYKEHMVLTEEQLQIADINGNGIVDLADAYAILLTAN